MYNVLLSLHTLDTFRRDSRIIPQLQDVMNAQASPKSDRLLNVVCKAPVLLQTKKFLRNVGIALIYSSIFV